MKPSNDLIDRTLYLAHSGRPHCKPIAHLERSHRVSASANYLLEALMRGRKDPDTARILAAILGCCDRAPDSPFFGCCKCYAEDPEIYDTNAAFFTGAVLAELWLGYREALSADEAQALRAVFEAMAPWFRGLARSPVLYYANKCIGDAAVLMACGHILGKDDLLAEGRDFCDRYFDYVARRGVCGEDHSPGYSGVILEMTLLIMAFERSGPGFEKARGLADALVEWALFHDGLDAVPSIRGYNFDGKIARDYAAYALLDPPRDKEGGDTDGSAVSTFAMLRDLSGYRYRHQPLDIPRQRRWRTFDAHFSASYVGSHARLGTLSYFPLQPDIYMRDDSGAGWQSKPCAFIVEREEYGVLEWSTEDAAGIIRTHPCDKDYHDFAGRCLFARESFHPDVVLVGHQEGGAAIILREIHRLHSPTRRLVDRWRLAHGAGRLLLDGGEWDGKPTTIPPQWIVLRYADCAVAIRPLLSRGLDTAAPADPDGRHVHLRERLMAEGNVAEPPLRIEKSDRGILLSNVLFENHGDMVNQRLLYSGWCVVLLDKPEDVSRLSVRESVRDDHEMARIYGAKIRSVELTTPHATLRLVRDMLTGEVARYVNDKRFRYNS